MSSLIPIIDQGDEVQAVMGRDLHAFLEVATPYDKWFPRMVAYGFDEGLDFSTKMSESTGGRPRVDHIVRLDMAKEISMIQRTAKGKQARQYFIECERRVKAQKPDVAQLTRMELLQMAMDSEKERLALETRNKELEPKALFADAVSTSDTDILVGELAKILRGNGVEIGQNRMFAWLRENGFLIARKGADWNMPTQKAMDLELFRIKETVVSHSDGHVSVKKTTKVTGKGQQYFIARFLEGKFNV